MNLFDRLLSKWRDSDRVRRLAAIEAMTRTEVLAAIAKTTRHSDVGAAAIEKITDDAVLEELASKARRSEVRDAAKLKIDARAALRRSLADPPPRVVCGACNGTGRGWRSSMHGGGYGACPRCYGRGHSPNR
jgi:hypothetical protein